MANALAVPLVNSVGERMNFSEIVSRVAYGNEYIRLTRRDKNVAAIISMDGLELLLQIEDRLDRGGVMLHVLLDNAEPEGWNDRSHGQSLSSEIEDLRRFSSAWKLWRITKCGNQPANVSMIKPSIH